ncbi:MAG: hypothetical protein DRP85_06815 [Candidatus Makaraimicrobium thalassicum]|nr:MAG: hypothetical protein DRP85_06815 [Candidatus Omnitrophota bacterium]
MTISDNSRSVREIEARLSEKLPIKLGVNKKNELGRLVYEISRGRGLSPEDVIQQAEIDRIIDCGKSGLFHKVKRTLLGTRYPSSGPDDDPHIMPVKIDPARKECPVWDLSLDPRTIFVEKSVRSFKWTEDFTRKFPRAEVVEVKDSRDVVREVSTSDPVSMYDSRRDRVLLVRARSGFVKICPCTKGYKRCGYWILNVGFGCPIDCSYCYLQMYSNAPGLILPVNIDDYYGHIERFDRQVKGRTRIGTGEFTDSLALDMYTGYSTRLIPFFRKMRNLVLELKTKSANIENVLREEPHENVVISWSVNPQDIADRYEKGSVTMAQRLDAAERAAEKGYKTGFHFDPVIYSEGWEDAYKAVVEDIFSREALRKNTVWVSLGTLRYTPGFKQIVEQRFAENLMFYQGEFFVDTDGKLRYPRDVRIDIYNKMISWIMSFDTSCWIYLCMEPEEVWKKTIVPLREWPLPEWNR